MQIQKIHCYHVRIPLRLTFGQANQSTQTSDSFVLRLETAAGTVGYGECGPRSYVSGEDAEQVRRTIQDLTRKVYAQQFEQVADIEKLILYFLDEGYGPAGVCALELTLLDAWSKEYQLSLRTALGAAETNELPYSGIVPYGAWDKLAPILTRFRFKQWKFKATSDWQFNVERIQRLRSLPGMDYVAWPHGRDQVIRMDANGAWSMEQAQINIEQALAQGVTSFEQPVPVEQESVAQFLTTTYGPEARIMADEALVSYADAQRIAEEEIYNHFNLKLSKNGGIFNSLRIHKLARQYGIPCQLGAQYGETSLLSAAGALFTDLVPELTAREGALGTWLLQADLTTKPLMIDKRGKLVPPQTGFGFGVEVDELRLNRYSLRTDFWKKK